MAVVDTESDTEFLVLGGNRCRIGKLQPVERHLASLHDSTYRNDLTQKQIFVDSPDRLTYGTEGATSVPEMTDEQAAAMEWMPLGVFALTAEGVNASSMYLQLTRSKEGVIAGTFCNESTGATHPVEGMIDEKTQRAEHQSVSGRIVDPGLAFRIGAHIY